MSIAEVYQALKDGHVVCYRTNRYIIHIDMFGELTCEDTATTVFTSASLDDNLIGKPSDYYIRGSRIVETAN